MKLTVYLRVAEGKRGARVAAATAPNYEPLYSGQPSAWNSKPLPTAAFALDLEIPDAIFDRASQVLAEIIVPEDEATVAAEVRTPVEA